MKLLPSVIWAVSWKFFTSKFNLSEDKILKINDKLKEIKTGIIRKELKKKALFKELKKFLITMVGPIAETVMEDCMIKLGCTEESFTSHQLDSLIEMFSCKFNFTADDALKITDKIQKMVDWEIKQNLYQELLLSFNCSLNIPIKM